MIRICAVVGQHIQCDLALQEIDLERTDCWYWIDVCEPTTDEHRQVLEEYFRFDHKAIEACLIDGERPQIHFFEGYHLVVINSITQGGLTPREVNAFISKKYLVTVHKQKDTAIEETWKLVHEGCNEEEEVEKGPLYLLHYILDKIVDCYFPPVYDIEDRLNEMDDNINVHTAKHSLDELFQIRSELARMRRSLVPMRDLLYRIIHSHRFEKLEKMENDREKHYRDIYNHLVRLVEMLESNRELVADIRDSYISVTSDFTNDIMKKLTIISTIFMPLTFIAGVYGMNFTYMPELAQKPAYFIVLSVMVFLSLWMYMWFKKKGWFDK
ncbi:magnesium/cobalt transporter CorA [Microbacteriaceae bacterium 4G12]